MRYIVYLLLCLGLCQVHAESHKPQAFLQSIAGKPDEGQQIIQHYCLNCHAKNPLISLNAPAIGDTKAWEARMKQGLSVLFEHTDSGMNAMPARGGCFECSDKQLMLAILALLPQKNTKNL
jgi:cytochrome c5